MNSIGVNNYNNERSIHDGRNAHQANGDSMPNQRGENEKVLRDQDYNAKSEANHLSHSQQLLNNDSIPLNLIHAVPKIDENNNVHNNAGQDNINSQNSHIHSTQNTQQHLQQQTTNLFQKISVSCQATLRGHTGPVWSLAGYNSNHIISGSSDTTVKVWDVASKKNTGTLEGHQDIVHTCVVINDHVISGSADRQMKRWDLNTEKCISTTTPHKAAVCSLLYSSSLLFSGSFTEVKVWDPVSYDEIETLSGHNHWVRAIACSGSRLFSGSYNMIKLWDLNTFKCQRTQMISCGSIHSLCVSDKYLLAGTYENLIYVYSLSSFELITKLYGHFGAIYSVCISENNLLFSGSYDNMIKIWNLDTLKCEQTLARHKSSVEALLPWNGAVYSGSSDSSIKKWLLR